MKTVMILFAGVLLSSFAMRAAGNRQSEGRHQACCLNLHREKALANSTVNDSYREAYFRAKYGRNSPIEEARLKTEKRDLATHGRKCLELGKCPLMPAQADAKKQPAAPVKKPERVLTAAIGNVPCEDACCQHGE